MINDPDYVAKLLYQLVKDNPDAFDRRRFRRFPTSIETLDPSSPILKSLLAMKPGPGVAYHSIIGSLRPGGVDDSTDGVVPYRSAHLDGVESEQVVRSDHGVQKDGEAILEVRRILREHIGLASETARTGAKARYSAPARPQPPQLPRGPSCCRPCRDERARSFPGGSRDWLLNSGEVRGTVHDRVDCTTWAFPASSPR